MKKIAFLLVLLFSLVNLTWGMLWFVVVMTLTTIPSYAMTYYTELIAGIPSRQSRIQRSITFTEEQVYFNGHRRIFFCVTGCYEVINLTRIYSRIPAPKN